MSKSMPRQESVKARSLLKYLQQKPESYQFLKPVDYKGLGLTDYLDIVKKPMDLSTVKRQLQTSVYSTFNQVLQDLLLIWKNCKLYNPQGTYFYKQAQLMEQHMNNYIAPGNGIVVPQKRQRGNSVQPISYQAKLELVKLMQQREYDQVGRVVELIQSQCPQALEKISQDKIQIKVDSLDRNTFLKALEQVLSRVVSSDVSESPMKKKKSQLIMIRMMAYIRTQTIGQTRLLQIDNPSQKNALNQEVLFELNSKLFQADQDQEIKSLVLTGSDDIFASGGNIAHYLPYDLNSAYTENIVFDFDQILKVRKPIIAGIRGYALGGGFQIALRCDIIYAAKSALMGHPQMKIAAVPGVGSTQVLPRRVGKFRAMEMILDCRILKAEEALQFGIVSKVFQDSEILSQCIDLSHRINKRSLVELLDFKKLIKKSEN